MPAHPLAGVPAVALRCAVSCLAGLLTELPVAGRAIHGNDGRKHALAQNRLVPKVGVEPTRVTPHDFESCASAIPPLRHTQKRDPVYSQAGASVKCVPLVHCPSAHQCSSMMTATGPARHCRRTGTHCPGGRRRPRCVQPTGPDLPEPGLQRCLSHAAGQDAAADAVQESLSRRFAACPASKAAASRAG